MTAATDTVGGMTGSRTDAIAAWARRNAWTLGLLVFLAILLAFTKFIQPSYGVTGVQGLAISVLPLALAAVGQAIVVISGGIDLSIGALMALTSVIAASQMLGQSEGFGVAVVIGVLALGLVLGAINGALVVVTRVPDIVVTLAMSFVWAGCALLVLNRPGRRLGDLAEGDHQGLARQRVDPQGGDRPDRRHRRRSGSRSGARRRASGSTPSGATGSRRSGAACRSAGRRSSPTRCWGCSPRSAASSLTASTGIGTPVPGPYTLLSVAAVVLGGVSLAGGRGGIVGPLIAVAILQLIRTDMTFLRFDPNLAVVAQGVILIGVVMVGSLVQLRRQRG